MQYANCQSLSKTSDLNTTQLIWHPWCLTTGHWTWRFPKGIFWFCSSHQWKWSKYTSCCLLGLAPLTFDTLRDSTESFLNSLCERSPVIDFLFGCFVRESKYWKLPQWNEFYGRQELKTVDFTITGGRNRWPEGNVILKPQPASTSALGFTVADAYSQVIHKFCRPMAWQMNKYRCQKILQIASLGIFLRGQRRLNMGIISLHNCWDLTP